MGEGALIGALIGPLISERAQRGTIRYLDVNDFVYHDGLCRYEPPAAILPSPAPEEPIQLRPWRLVIGAHDGQPDHWTDHGNNEPTFLPGIIEQ